MSTVLSVAQTLVVFACLVVLVSCLVTQMWVREWHPSRCEALCADLEFRARAGLITYQDAYETFRRSVGALYIAWPWHRDSIDRLYRASDAYLNDLLECAREGRPYYGYMADKLRGAA